MSIIKAEKIKGYRAKGTEMEQQSKGKRKE